MAVPYFFSMINPGTVVMGTLFLTFLSILAYIFSKVFRDKYGNVSTVTVGIVSFCASTLIVFFGKDTIYNIVEGLRFSNTILYVLSGLAILILLFLFRRRLRFCMLLMLIGAGLILIGAITDWFYQKWFVIIFGVILLLLGIWLCSKGRGMSKALGQALNTGGKRSKPSGGISGGKNILIREARAFKGRALKSKNPKFYGGWAHFIRHLNTRGYGRTEREIINNLGINKRQFVGIFRRYGLVK